MQANLALMKYFPSLLTVHTGTEPGKLKENQISKRLWGSLVSTPFSSVFLAVICCYIGCTVAMCPRLYVRRCEHYEGTS